VDEILPLMENFLLTEKRFSRSWEILLVRFAFCWWYYSGEWEEGKGIWE